MERLARIAEVLNINISDFFPPKTKNELTQEITALFDTIQQQQQQQQQQLDNLLYTIQRQVAQEIHDLKDSLLKELQKN